MALSRGRWRKADLMPQLTPASVGQWSFSTSERVSDPEWDDFVYSLPEPHHEQTSLWSQVRSRYRWRPVRIVMRDRGAIVAGVQILERRVGRFVAVGYVPRGPLVSEGVDGSLVIAEMRRVAVRDFDN
jgi:lipid II:glycine glycyltransferase (peptidoglycan interpeptide bridge formation enzyme)